MEEKEDIEIDTAIAVEIYGHKILGSATCAYAEGDWSVHPSSDPSGWACHASIRPVYVDHCYCANSGHEELTWTEKFPELGNHEGICLSPVLPYAVEIDLALFALRKIKPCGFSLTFIDDVWIAELYDATQIYSAQVQGEIGDTRHAAKALCLAMLDYVRGGARIPRQS